ncbi:MAG: hypothetical protein IBJ10_03445 [Phycisphaerales bacterium]|nr:hypothetical protein [Phycisphaerales bacterium]
MKASDCNLWILSMLLLAGSLFGAVASLARMLTTPLYAATYGAVVGLPLGILSTPIAFACVRDRPAWIVAVAVLAPTTIAAFIGGWNRNQYPLGSIITAIPLTAAVYIVSALVVHFAVPASRPAERPEGAEGA